MDSVELKLVLNHLLRDEIVNPKVQKETPIGKSFLTYIKNSLKLSSEDKWAFLCAAMDTIEDSQSVVQEFLQFGMEGKTKVSTRGEKLMRLYGVLNAIYVEKEALFELGEIWKANKNKKFEEKISALKIFELRNISAHINKYKKEDGLECYFFALYEPGNFEISIGRHSGGFKKLQYNMKELVDEYQKETINYFLEVLTKIGKMIYKTDQNKLNRFLNKIGNYYDVLQGTLIIRGNSEIIIHTKIVRPTI